MKSQIFICRHAESVEDVDKNIYATVCDREIPLTTQGCIQAANLAIELRTKIAVRSYIYFFTPPTQRNQQTVKIIQEKLSDHSKTIMITDSRINKQDWGSTNVHNRARVEAERYRIGVLRYTFPDGESAENVVRRFSSFAADLISWQLHSKNMHACVVCNGFESRVLLKVLLGWNEEYFESLANMKNCEFRILTLQEDGTCVLNEPLRKHGLPVTRTGKR